MTFIVKWYGDQPVDAAGHLARSHGLWLAFLVGGFLLGAVAPIVGCAWERVRQFLSRRHFALGGRSAIAGIGDFPTISGSPNPQPRTSLSSRALLAVVAMAGVSLQLRAPYRSPAVAPGAGSLKGPARGRAMTAQRNGTREQPDVSEGVIAAIMAGFFVFVVLVCDRPLFLRSVVGTLRDVRETRRVSLASS